MLGQFMIRQVCGGEQSRWLAEGNGSAITQVGGYLFCNSCLSLEPSVGVGYYVAYKGSSATERGAEEMCLQGSPGLEKIFCQN